MEIGANDALGLWHRVMVSALGRDMPDMTQRQFALLLEIYLGTPPHTFLTVPRCRASQKTGRSVSLAR